MSKKNILYITYMGLNEPLMLSQAIPYLRGLVMEGKFNITILSFEKSSGIIDKTEIVKHLASHHIQCCYLKYHKRPYVFSTGYDILAGILAGIWMSVRNKVKLVHARGTTPAIMAFFISRVIRCPYLFDIRGFMADEYVDGGMWKRGGFLYKMMHRIENFLIRHSDSKVVLTRKAVAILEKRNLVNNKKIEVIPSCVDLDKFKFQDKFKAKAKLGFNKKFILVYIGSLGTWYMLDEMLDFFMLLKDSRPDAFFLIITQIKTDFLKRRILQKRLRLDSFIIRTLSPEDVPLYLSAADLGICFIRPCFSKLSSSPTKIGEYLASGLPVLINSGIGDCDQIIRDSETGIIIDTFSERSYKEAMNRLNTLLVDGISNRCIETAKEVFSLRSAVQNYKTIYERLVF